MLKKLNSISLYIYYFTLSIHVMQIDRISLCSRPLFNSAISRGINQYWQKENIKEFEPPPLFEMIISYFCIETQQDDINTLILASGFLFCFFISIWKFVFVIMKLNVWISMLNFEGFNTFLTNDVLFQCVENVCTFFTVAIFLFFFFNS